MPEIVHITSRQNPLVKEVQKLRAKPAYRRQQGVFLAEGHKLCADAADAGAQILWAVCSDQAQQRYPEACRLVLSAAARSYTATDEVFLKLSGQKAPQGVLCGVAEQSVLAPLDQLDVNKSYLLLEQVSDPGNVGTILRTAAALGLGGILLDSGCADCLGDKAVRASMGSIFKLPVYRVDSAPDTVAWLKRQGLPVYGSTLSCRSVDIGQVDLRAPCAVVIGNEGRGITEPTAAACDQLVHIPITPAAESLNAAAAAAIFSWEMMR